MQISEINFTQHSRAVAGLAASDVVGLHAENWPQCYGLTAKTGTRKLSHRVAHASEAQTSDVRLGRESLVGRVEVDETHLGGSQSGVYDRQLVDKALVVIAVELEASKVGRIRLRHVPDGSAASLSAS